MDVETITAYILGISISCYFLYGLYFLKLDPNPNRLKKLLGWILVTWSAFLLKDILYFHERVLNNDHIYKSLLCIDNWAVVMGNIFTIELLSPDKVTWKLFLYNISGFVILTIIYILTGSEPVFTIYHLYTIIYCTVTFIYIIINTIRYKKLIRQNYSNLTDINILWIWQVTSFLLLTLVIWTVVFFTRSNIYDIVYYITMLLIWTVISINTSKQKLISKDDRYASVHDGDDGNSCEKTVTESDKYEFDKKIETLKKENYFFNNPELTLTELASELNTNRTTLSIYINNVIGCTFYEMINNIRLEYAEELLVSNPKMTQDEVAVTAGFNSISTFRRYFKKKNGTTPAEFRNSKIDK